MTIISISISTKGLWVELLGLELGIQWTHSRAVIPYASITAWRWRAHINARGICIDRKIYGAFTRAWTHPQHNFTEYKC